MIDENSPEQWVFIPKTLSQYLINNYGDVKQMIDGKPRHVRRFLANHRNFVRINSKALAVHRLLATAFLPNPAKKPLVRFKDNNTANLKLSNLEWIGYNELRGEKVKPFLKPVKAKRTRTGRHHASTENILPQLKEWAKNGEPAKYIAYMTKLSENHVRHLIKQYNLR